MTIKKFYLYTFLQFIIMTIVKIWFFKNDLLGSPGLQILLFWAVVGVLAAALVRRIGVMNYLESFFTVIVWVLVGLLLDLLITSAYAGLSIFSTVEYWVGLFVLAIAVVAFHKKRHLAVREGKFVEPKMPH